MIPRSLSRNTEKKLVCVRYRYDAERKKRYKTVEIIVDEAPWNLKDKVRCWIYISKDRCLYMDLYTFEVGSLWPIICYALRSKKVGTE